MGGFLNLVFYSLQDKTVSTNAKIGNQPKAIIGGQQLLLNLHRHYRTIIQNTYRILINRMVSSIRSDFKCKK